MGRLNLVPQHLADMPFPGLVRSGFISDVIAPTTFTGGEYDANYASWNHTLDDQNFKTTSVGYDFRSVFEDEEFWGWDNTTNQIVRAKFDAGGVLTELGRHTAALPANWSYIGTQTFPCRVSATRLVLVGAWSVSGSNQGSALCTTWNGTTFSAFAAPASPSFRPADAMYASKVRRLRNDVLCYTNYRHGVESSGYVGSIDTTTGVPVHATLAYGLGDVGAGNYAIRNLERLTDTTALLVNATYNSSYTIPNIARINFPGGSSTPYVEAQASHPDNTHTHDTSYATSLHILPLSPTRVVYWNYTLQAWELWDVSGTPTRLSSTTHTAPGAQQLYGLTRLSEREFLWARRNSAGFVVIGRGQVQNDNTIAILGTYPTTDSIGQNTISTSLVGDPRGAVLPGNRALLKWRTSTDTYRYMLTRAVG